MTTYWKDDKMYVKCNLDNLIKGDKTMADEEKAVKPGAFLESLKRNNTKIRADRAEAIGEDAEIIYKREVEDLRLRIKRMERERENMLDQSPDNALSLKLATDFDAKEYVAKDIDLGVRIREATIKLEIATKQYTYLFGGDA